MAQVGCLGDIVFAVSSEAIETVDNFVWSGSAQYASHKLHLGNELLEFTGTNADSISFSVFLATYLGVDPQKEINKIWDYERKGKLLPLIMGDKGYGKYRWVITSHKSQLKFDGKGNALDMDVSLTLSAYVRF